MASASAGKGGSQSGYQIQLGQLVLLTAIKKRGSLAAARTFRPDGPIPWHPRTDALPRAAGRRAFPLSDAAQPNKFAFKGLRTGAAATLQRRNPGIRMVGQAVHWQAVQTAGLLTAGIPPTPIAGDSRIQIKKRPVGHPKGKPMDSNDAERPARPR